MASSFFNLGSIGGGVIVGWLIDPHFGPKAVLGLAVGTLIGGALQLIVQLPALRRIGYLFRPDFAWKDRGVRAILTRSKGKAAFIGDGVSDLEAKPTVDLFIGFGGVAVRERVRNEADVFVEQPTLRAVLTYLLEL